MQHKGCIFAPGELAVKPGSRRPWPKTTPLEEKSRQRVDWAVVISTMFASTAFVASHHHDKNHSQHPGTRNHRDEGHGLSQSHAKFRSWDDAQ